MPNVPPSVRPVGSSSAPDGSAAPSTSSPFVLSQAVSGGRRDFGARPIDPARYAGRASHDHNGPCVSLTTRLRSVRGRAASRATKYVHTLANEAGRGHAHPYVKPPPHIRCVRRRAHPGRGLVLAGARAPRRAFSGRGAVHLLIRRFVATNRARRPAPPRTPGPRRRQNAHRSARARRPSIVGSTEGWSAVPARVSTPVAGESHTPSARPGEERRAPSAGSVSWMAARRYVDRPRTSPGARAGGIHA